MDLAARAQRLNLSNLRLSQITGLDKNTVGRALRFQGDRSGGPQRSTYLTLEMALAQAEHDLLRALAADHPAIVIELSRVALCPERQPPARSAA